MRKPIVITKDNMEQICRCAKDFLHSKKDDIVFDVWHNFGYEWNNIVPYNGVPEDFFNVDDVKIITCRGEPQILLAFITEEKELYLNVGDEIIFTRNKIIFRQLWGIGDTKIFHVIQKRKMLDEKDWFL